MFCERGQKLYGRVPRGLARWGGAKSFFPKSFFLPFLEKLAQNWAQRLDSKGDCCLVIVTGQAFVWE